MRRLLSRTSKTFKDNIVRRAIDLHQQIASSSYDYLIMSPGSSDWCEERFPMNPSSCLRRSRTPSSGDQFYDDVAGVFQCLYPGIYRRGMPGEENVLAAPPVVLVYDHTSPKTLRGTTRRSQSQRHLQQNQDMESPAFKSNRRIAGLRNVAKRRTRDKTLPANHSSDSMEDYPRRIGGGVGGYL
ncbi:hypothetical protein BGW36DRAFT_412066 [Talaromyces proteolyticus]|uniref:Uncharacterized protein n=1 Tax=Talaromyces proteolyticus TaxID=1131652 RepID=A0AAD4KFA1_9EURO|nr:uncharacterized protein BGW36DRAFT_412066 [Talaromyces proteolyticus]KAH8690254.1 hypothetical protein BGW36DRAFT_412066 [Talaromyces proteolyticus]